MNRRGNARDVLLITVLVFALGIGFLAINYVMNQSIDGITAVSVINESSSSVTAFHSLQSQLARLDYIVLAYFIGFILFMMISAWLVGGHPIFMFIYFIFVVIATAISPVLSNAWESFSQASIFGSTVSSFPIANNILSYLPIYVAVIGLVGMILMFAKPYNSGGAAL